MKKLGELLVYTVIVILLALVVNQSGISSMLVGSVGAAEVKKAEPVKMVVVYKQEMQRLPLPDGLVSWFGGIEDSWERGNPTALGPRINDLRTDKDYFCAFRFPKRMSRYSLRKGYIEFKNPANGVVIRAKIVDWGPAEWTGRSYDLSRRLIRDLGLVTDEKVEATLFLPL